MIHIYLNYGHPIDKQPRSGHYVIHEDPTPLARPRLGKHGHLFDPQKQIKLLWQIGMQSQHEGPPFSGPLLLDLIFYMPIPQSMSQRKQELISGSWHAIRPDNSNLLKFLEDAGNKVLFNDDAQFSAIFTRKVYDKDPRAEFTIVELK